MPTIRQAGFRDLDPWTLYDVLRLRVDVFVVEQACAYHELDGLDTDPAALHLWIDDDGVASYVRLLLPTPGREARIGRVVTAAGKRGLGYSSALLDHALDLVGEHPVGLEAQVQLHDWYQGFGFRPVGEAYLEDGIPHIPMRRG